MTTPRKTDAQATIQIVKGKVPLRRIPSDDYFEEVGGVRYQTHADEWIELRPGAVSLDTMAGFGDLLQMGSALESLQDGDADNAAQIRPAIHAAAEALAAVIPRWSWTDPSGNPMGDVPTAETMKKLGLGELMYLARLVQGGPGAETEDSLKA